MNAVRLRRLGIVSLAGSLVALGGFLAGYQTGRSEAAEDPAPPDEQAPDDEGAA